MDISFEEDDRSTLDGSNDETDTLTHKTINKHERSLENRIMEATIGQICPLNDPHPPTSSGGIIESKCLKLKNIEDSSVSVFVDEKMPFKEIVSSAHKIDEPKDSAQLIRHLSPIPRTKIVQNRLSKGTTAAQVLTERPYKNDLEKKSDDNEKKKVKLNLNKGAKGKVGYATRIN
ncbi:unnamed protein product [Acanthoscelides obtectus]|uniref:Uncharacterized protein n=1 Tax=Acanthoscelides obtectus TaxID=200917 RepID=A0A9P0QC63_ACAOB|nr:unnamed protein product [Acanthoscelides obtectus]CAK1672327.1 hypothetical protein AOBTE_LOCUS28792 [Acanthoscelides obtectus]